MQDPTKNKENKSEIGKTSVRRSCWDLCRNSIRVSFASEDLPPRWCSRTSSSEYGRGLWAGPTVRSRVLRPSNRRLFDTLRHEQGRIESSHGTRIPSNVPSSRAHRDRLATHTNESDGCVYRGNPVKKEQLAWVRPWSKR